MLFKDFKSVMAGLKAWREKRLKVSERKVFFDRHKTLLPFKEQQLGKYENGRADPDLTTFIEQLLPAYGIKYLDRFLLGYCPPTLNGLSEVRHLRLGDGIDAERKYNKTVRYGVSDPMFLGRFPVRVDRFVVPKGECSTKIQHDGYNYLVVTRGQVRCELEEHIDGKVIVKSFDLQLGESLLFPTTLWHSIEATGEELTSEFIVATPSWAAIDDVVERS